MQTMESALRRMFRAHSHATASLFGSRSLIKSIVTATLGIVVPRIATGSENSCHLTTLDMFKGFDMRR